MPLYSGRSQHMHPPARITGVSLIDNGRLAELPTGEIATARATRVARYPEGEQLAIDEAKSQSHASARDLLQSGAARPWWHRDLGEIQWANERRGVAPGQAAERPPSGRLVAENLYAQATVPPQHDVDEEEASTEHERPRCESAAHRALPRREAHEAIAPQDRETGRLEVLPRCGIRAFYLVGRAWLGPPGVARESVLDGFEDRRSTSV
jgi:hypothetical protein